MSWDFAAPLRAVDHVSIAEARSDIRLEAVKEIVADDPYLVGHYPGFTIYPGVFTIESVHQAIRQWARHRYGPRARTELISIASVSFKAPLLPAATMRITCDVAERSSDPLIVRGKARCTREDVLAARMTLELRVHREGEDA